MAGAKLGSSDKFKGELAVARVGRVRVLGVYDVGWKGYGHDWRRTKQGGEGLGSRKTLGNTTGCAGPHTPL